MEVETIEAPKPYYYKFIPRLEDLLPKSGGVPGVKYAIVAISNARKAQDEGWERLAGNQKIFTIEGPEGSVDCELFGLGKPMRGLDHFSGKRVCMIDKVIRETTGFGRKDSPLKGESDSTVAVPAVKSAAGKT